METPLLSFSDIRMIKGNALAADYFEEKLNEFGLTTTVQDWSATGENVIATQPGCFTQIRRSCYVHTMMPFPRE